MVLSAISSHKIKSQAPHECSPKRLKYKGFGGVCEAVIEKVAGASRIGRVGPTPQIDLPMTALSESCEANGFLPIFQAEHELN